MTYDYEVKQYDTDWTIQRNLMVSGSFIDLTSASVKLNIYTPYRTTYTRDVTVDDAVSGSVTYDFVDGDTSIAGLHKLEFKVTDENGNVIRIPTKPYYYRYVYKAIGI